MRKQPDPKIERLRAIPGVGGMSEPELARLASLADECELPAGTVLVREGTAGRSTYVILEGWAAVSVGGTPIAALGPGDHIGEMAVLDNQPRSATVTAKTPMRVLVIGPAALATYLSAPGVVRSIAVGLAERVRSADAKADSAAQA